MCCDWLRAGHFDWIKALILWKATWTIGVSDWLKIARYILIGLNFLFLFFYFPCTRYFSFYIFPVFRSFSWPTFSLDNFQVSTRPPVPNFRVPQVSKILFITFICLLASNLSPLFPNLVYFKCLVPISWWVLASFCLVSWFPLLPSTLISRYSLVWECSRVSLDLLSLRTVFRCPLAPFYSISLFSRFPGSSSHYLVSFLLFFPDTP